MLLILVTLLACIVPAQGAGDSDGDGVPNNADNCMQVPNPGQEDCDDDGVGDVCDANNDADGDGVDCPADNCPFVPNANQFDSDGDGPGDTCDNCPFQPNANQADLDGDGLGNVCDPWGNRGLLDDGQEHLPPAYETDPLPALGATFNDAAFGSPIRRLTDSLDPALPVAKQRGLIHEYSSISPFNAGSGPETRILLFRGNPIGAQIVDVSGNLIREDIPVAGQSQPLGRGNEPRWSTTNPDVLYYHTASHVYRYDLANQVHWTIAGPFGGPVGVTSEGDAGLPPGGGSEVDYLPLHIGSETGPGTLHRLTIYDSGATLLGPALTGGTLGSGASWGIDWCDLTSLSGNMICRIRNITTSSDTVEVFNGATGAFIRQVTPWAGHSDRATYERSSTQNDEVLVMVNNSGDPQHWLPGCEPPALERIDIWTGERLCLLSFAHSGPTGGAGLGGMHISVNNTANQHPWVLVSTYDASRGTMDLELPGNWKTKWGAYFNELFLVRLDASQVFRLAHHRSRQDPDDPTEGNCEPCLIPDCPAPPVCNSPAGPCNRPNCGAGCENPGIDLVDTYFALPRAAIGRDGQYALFDSNWGTQLCSDYREVYVLEPFVFLP
jgi:hypothetical protein